MKRLLLAFLLLAVALRASPETDTLIRLTREFDTAVASENRAALSALLHADYAYTGPELPPKTSEVPLSVVAQRLLLLTGESTAPVARVVGPTAIVTGGYSVNQGLASPRFIARGRFTTTWVRQGDQWQIVAEHRSLNDELEWAPSQVAQTRANRKSPAVAALPSPAGSADPAPIVTSGQIPTTPPPPPTPRTVFASTDNTKKTGREENFGRHGHLPKVISQLFRSYEPSQLGYTKDQGDDPFMDFTFSAMFPLPLVPGEYPDPVRRSTDENFYRHTRFTGPHLYFAATMRAGQYIGTRPSSPVVSKRFNPLLSLRFWATDRQGRRESEDNFLELVYGHESNGQFIASPGRFNDQLRVYLNQAIDAPTPDAATLANSTARLAARDNISRGWDYVGLQFARDWDTNFFDSWAPDATIALRAKLNYYLRKGALQGDSEQFNPRWETSPSNVLPDPEGKDRKYVDGLSFRYTLTVAPPRGEKAPTGWAKLLRFERRYALTWTTGYVEPFRYNTLKAEAGLNIYGLPLMIWYRLGYNSDLVDYYRQDHSYGLNLSFWNF